MPFVRVSYLEQAYSDQQLKAASEAIMAALTVHFNVPEDDYFQVFHAHRKSEFNYSRNYLNVERSDGLLYIQITLKSGRSTEQKKSFYRLLAEKLSAALPMRREDVFVVLVDTEFEDWSFGNGIAQMLNQPEAQAEALG
ncbi:tautomerase family protein [Paenibacillus sp. MMS18-CY102]|uniref:tautomerase family protein n=1 Tax=Paenibacillus sp. MMS18-CY102 TaxID=2682849 RepID=UPI001365BEFF|nr:tautomerase family protein [Paenibacillus sp. MMS18-CY102]MWC28824.1 tautomerase family protein [Paenibacillus sp. MMS18-CY102]